MQMAEIADYAARTFLDAKGSGLPSPEVAQGFVFTAASFVIGWAASRDGAHRRLKTRVINELILSQSELKARAWPQKWRMNDTRETWMLQPFVARLRYLHADLEERKALKGKQRTLIDNYICRVEEFIEVWSVTQRRAEGYRYSYDVGYNAMKSAVKELGFRDNSRFAGLKSPKDDLLGAVHSSGAPQVPLTLAPAE